MKLVFMFSGQGSQYSGMLKSAKQYPDAIDVYQRADEILGFEISRMCLTSPQEELRKTHITQPAIFTHSIALACVLKSYGIFPEVVVGHSIGEFAALVTANVIGFEDALKVVEMRGTLMSRVKREGTMLAIAGLNANKVNQLCKEASEVGYSDISLHNTPTQYVVSGETQAVKCVENLAKQAGAVKTTILNVSHAFHSKLMEEIESQFFAILDEVEFNDATVPIVLNCTAKYSTKKNEIKEDLKKQIICPVLWHQSIKLLIEEGYMDFVEVGPGRVLCGLLRNIDKGRNSYNIDSPQEMRRLKKSRT